MAVVPLAALPWQPSSSSSDVDGSNAEESASAVAGEMAAQQVSHYLEVGFRGHYLEMGDGSAFKARS
jgi:hypothetical protein